MSAEPYVASLARAIHDTRLALAMSGGAVRQKALKDTPASLAFMTAVNDCISASALPHPVLARNVGLVPSWQRWSAWQEGATDKAAIESASAMLKDRPTLVYLDPPYTRDEYSRYYHVLETLIHYNYPLVADKAAIPIKGSAGRFASEFFTRSASSVEGTIATIISTCLENKWSCLWSYSSSGIANVENVLRRVGAAAQNVEIFKAKYAYKPQGKRRMVGNDNQTDIGAQASFPGFENIGATAGASTKMARPVDEYLIMIRP